MPEHSCPDPMSQHSDSVSMVSPSSCFFWDFTGESDVRLCWELPLFSTHYNAFFIWQLVTWWGKRVCVCFWSGSCIGALGSTRIQGLTQSRPQATGPRVLGSAQLLLPVSFSGQGAQWGRHEKERKSGHRRGDLWECLKGGRHVETKSFTTPSTKALHYTHMFPTLNF